MCPKFRSVSYTVLAMAFASGTGVLLAACGNSSSSSTSAPNDTVTAATGELTARMARLKTLPGWLSSGCDGAFESAVVELAGILDGRAQKTAAAALKERQDHAKASQGGTQILDLGGLFITHDMTRAEPKHNGWSTQERGWRMVIEQFHKLKKAPTDAGWVSLDRATRAMLAYDERRIVDERNMNLSPSDQVGLLSLLQAYEDCLADTSCTEPTLDADAKNERDSNPLYISMSHQLHETSDPAQKRQVIKASLVVRLRADAEQFKARADHKAVTRVSSNLLELALDPGNVATTQTGLDRAASAIQAIWSSASLSVRVRWTQQGSPAGPGAFRLLVDSSPEEAPGVNYQDRTLMVAPGRSDRALAFEIGRVLGIGSHSFVDFNPLSCSYTVTSNDLDIMSVYATGSVTADEWQDLDRLYPADSATK